MRILIRAVICSLVVTCVMTLNGFYGACREIRGEVFRLHILANSDSEEDQALKLKVRDGLLDHTKELFANCRNREEAIEAAKENIESISECAGRILKDQGCDYPVRAYVTNMDFETREYDEFTLPAGRYDALRIEIGRAEGHNWWCVLFPVLCINASGKSDFSDLLNKDEESIVSDSESFEVRFKIVEFFERLCSYFG